MFSPSSCFHCISCFSYLNSNKGNSDKGKAPRVDKDGFTSAGSKKSLSSSSTKKVAKVNNVFAALALCDDSDSDSSDSD
jgi:hypothetical protein